VSESAAGSTSDHTEACQFRALVGTTFIAVNFSC